MSRAGTLVLRSLFVAGIALLLPPACGNPPRDFKHGAGGSAGEASGAAGRLASAGNHAGGSAGISSSAGAGGSLAIPGGGDGLANAGSNQSEAGKGGLSGSSAECPALTDPVNGVVDTRSTIPGTQATYSCISGYKLSGTATRTCDQGAWSGAAPTCVIQDCGTLTAPTDGSVAAPKTSYGSMATYSCKQGYGPSGSSTRTCQADGTWSGSVPTCVIANCPALASPTGGTVNAPTLTFGASATYACNAGYTLSSATPRQCAADGTWSGTAPTCTLKDCGALAAPTNGTISQPSTLVGGTATYACNSNYLLSGTATRQCQSSGTWSGTAATCGPKTANGGTCQSSSECQSANCSNYSVSGTSLCCQAGYASCGSCVDKQTDLNNCGSCGSKCALNRACQAGTCKCPGYAFPAACGGCGSWTFESGTTEGWAKDFDPTSSLASYNGVQNVQVTQAAGKVHEGSTALAVPVFVDYSSTSLAVVAVPFCNSGSTSNLAGFQLSFWIYFAGPAFDQGSDDVFLFVDAWSPTASTSSPALFKNKMVVDTWINVTLTYSSAISADHVAINFHPGGNWLGTMYIDAVKITGP